MTHTFFIEVFYQFFDNVSKTLRSYYGVDMNIKLQTSMFNGIFLFFFPNPNFVFRDFFSASMIFSHSKIFRELFLQTSIESNFVVIYFITCFGNSDFSSDLGTNCFENLGSKNIIANRDGENPQIIWNWIKHQKRSMSST